jgi:hypothetical protein
VEAFQESPEPSQSLGRVLRTALAGAILVVVTACSSGTSSGGTQPTTASGPTGSDSSTPSGSPSRDGTHVGRGAVRKVPYSPRRGEVCGLAATGTEAVIMSCSADEGGVSSTTLVSTDSHEPFRIPGVLAPQLASTTPSSRVLLPVWEMSNGAQMAAVKEVDMVTRRVISRPAGDGVPFAAATSGGQTFVGFGSGDVRAVLPEPTQVLHLGAPVRMLAVGDGKLWAIDSRGNVSLLDLHTQLSQANIARVPGQLGATAAVFNRRLWVSGRSLIAIDAKGAQETIHIAGSGVTNVVSCGGHLWVAEKTLDAGDGKASGLRALDAGGSSVRTVRTPFPGYLACAGNRLWLATADGRLYILVSD